MLPKPVKTGPGGALSINIDNDSMGDLGKAFGSALKPLVKGINNLNATLIKSMKPDPESKTDRGKDLIKGPDAGKEDGSKMSVGKFGFGALAVLAAALTGTTKELQGIVNTFAFPKTLKLLKAPFTLLKKGFGGIQKLFRGIGNFFKKQTGPAGLRKTFGKAGPVDKFFVSMKRVGDSIGNMGKNVKGKIGGFFKGGVIDKFFTSTKNMTDGVKNFSPSTLKTQAAFGKGGSLGKFFLSTGNFVDRVKSFLTPVKNVLGGIKKIMEPLKSLGGGLGSLLKPLMPLLKTIFFPITIIMGIIDGVKGFIEGYKDGGFIDGLLTGLGNIIGGIVGAPLDLLKNLAAFLLEKLGFKNVAEALKDFSFKDMIKNAFGGIANFFSNLPAMIEKAIRGIFGNKVGDFLFGEDKGAAIADAGKDATKEQGKAQSDIDMAKKQQKSQAVEQERIDKMKPGARKDRLQERLDKRKAATETKLAAAEDAKSGAVVKGLAAKTADIDTAAMFAKGASEEQVMEAAKGLDLTPEEAKMFQQKIANQAGLSVEDLAKESIDKKNLLATLSGGEAMTEEQMALQKQAFMGKAELERAGTSSLTKDAKMVDGKIVEGKTIDDMSGQVVNSVGGSSSVDNSQSDNSTTNNNSNITNNNYGGGGGGDTLNSRNPDNSLYSQNTTYAM